MRIYTVFLAILLSACAAKRTTCVFEAEHADKVLVTCLDFGGVGQYPTSWATPATPAQKLRIYEPYVRKTTP